MPVVALLAITVAACNPQAGAPQAGSTRILSRYDGPANPLTGVLLVSLVPADPSSDAPGSGPHVRLATPREHGCTDHLALDAVAGRGRLEIVVDGLAAFVPGGPAVECTAEFSVVERQLPVPAGGTVDVSIRYCGQTDLYRYHDGALVAVRTSTTRLGVE